MASESPRTVNGFVVFVGSVAAFVGVTLVGIAILAINRPSGPTLEDQRAKGRMEVAAKLEHEAQEKLNSAGWVDKAKGTVHVPIADALPIVAKELKAKKPAPSQVKIDAMLPMPVIDPNATEPPPPALTSSPQGADTIHFLAPVTPEVSPAPAATAAPTPAAPAAPAPAAPTAPTAPAAPEKLTPVPVAPLPPPAPAPAPPAPTQVTPPPAPAAPVPPPPAEPPAPKPAAPAPAQPAPAPTAPAQTSPINPTENSESTK